MLSLVALLNRWNKRELSNQVQRLVKMYFIRCPPLQTFARAVIQCQHRLFKVIIRILRNILMLRKIFTQQAVGVLVRAALPRLVRRRNVYFYPQRLRHHRMPRKFLAPVWRDAEHRLLAQGFNHRRIHAVRRLLLQPDAPQIAAFAVNQRQQHRTPTTPATVSASQSPSRSRACASGGRSDSACSTGKLSRVGSPLRRRFLPRWRSLCLPLITQSGSLKRLA